MVRYSKKRNQRKIKTTKTIDMIQKEQEQDERFKLTRKYKDLVLMGAIVRGFKNGVEFMSPNGVHGLVKGTLVVKDNGDSDFCGDLVSSSGYGCIYDRASDTWAQIIE